MSDQSFEWMLPHLRRISEEFAVIRQGIERAIQLAENDPEMALTRTRKVLEFVIREVCQRLCHENPGTRNLDELMRRVRGDMPPLLFTYANHIRELGNVGTHHYEQVTRRDVQ